MTYSKIVDSEDLFLCKLRTKTPSGTRIKCWCVRLPNHMQQLSIWYKSPSDDGWCLLNIDYVSLRKTIEEKIKEKAKQLSESASDGTPKTYELDVPYCWALNEEVLLTAYDKVDCTLFRHFLTQLFDQLEQRLQRLFTAIADSLWNSYLIHARGVFIGSVKDKFFCIKLCNIPCTKVIDANEELYNGIKKQCDRLLQAHAYRRVKKDLEMPMDYKWKKSAMDKYVALKKLSLYMEEGGGQLYSKDGFFRISNQKKKRKVLNERFLNFL